LRQISLVLLALLGGLAVMFVSLQVARTEERQNATLRLALYGYNAVLSGVVLLGVLGLINLLPYLRVRPFSALAATTDWTAHSLYSLAPASQNLLRDLEKPLKIYVILSGQREILRRDVQALLENVRAVNPKIEVEYLSPDFSQERVKELEKTYRMTDREGILLVYGIPPGEENDFVTADDLQPPQFDPHNQQGGPQSQFQGEWAIMQRLTLLTSSK